MSKFNELVRQGLERTQKMAEEQKELEKILLTAKEINENAAMERRIEEMKQQGYINMSELDWQRQPLVEWDGTISDVEIATLKDRVLVKYSDGAIYQEDRVRFETGKWAVSPVTEALEEYVKEQKRLMEKEDEFWGRYGFKKRRQPIQKDYVTVFRHGDTCRVLKDDLIIKEVTTIGTDHEVVMKGEMEDGTKVEICRFYPDEIWISAYEVKGKTLKEAGEVKEFKDRMYLMR